MLKFTTLIIALGAFSHFACAQKVAESNLSPTVKNAFSKLHPGVIADEWVKEGNNYEAEYKVNGAKASVQLGSNGQLISTGSEIKVAELPKTISDYFATNLAGKKISEASKITMADGIVNYEAEADGTAYIFDANGKFIRLKAK